ncbi:MAG: hypothetical protein M3Q07_11690 [Pseudobdellovibrionaceae bacterium]|nr:hypothetical protein [Pseudobdellovibrionaceae bacterium]
MSNFRTQRWTLILTLSVGMVAACQKAKLPKASDPENKSRTSLVACEDLNLARDAAWTAVFLRKFISCAAIQKNDKQETFDQSLRLIDAVGPEPLQKAMDLLLLRPASFAEDGVYPNLSAVITLMDRGTHDERGLALTGTEDRWNTLQTSLSSVRPRPVLQFLMALEDAGALDGFVAELIAWSDALPAGAISGLAHKVLTDAGTRRDIQQLQRATIDDPIFAERLHKLWQPRFFPWQGQSSGTEDPKTFFGHAQHFWNQASIDQQKRWAHTAAAVLRMGLETQVDELLRRTHDLYDLGRSYALRQTHFLTDLRAVLEQALQTSLKDLQPAMNGLNQIKDNPSYRDAFEEKAGSTYLHELVEDFIWEGGRLQSCPMEFAGMKSQPGLTHPRAILQPLLTPQAACQGRIPLLLYLDETLGLNCRTGVCARGWMTDEVQVDAADLSRLGTFAWSWLEKELRADPYRLKNRQLAYGPIEGETLEQLKIFWHEHLPRTAEELVQVDEKIAQDPRFQALLKKDFLEAWYGLTLQKLNTLADEFHDIWPDAKNPEGWLQKNSDSKLQRVGLGLYAFGTLDDAYARALPVHEAWQKLQADLPGVIDEGNFSQILNPLRELSSQIKSTQVSIKPETEKMTTEWPGGVASHLSYRPDGSPVNQVQPYGADRLVSDAANGWMMLSRYRDQLPLLTAAADPSRAKALEAWIQNQYLTEWSASLQKSLGLGTDDLPLDLFQGQALTREDVRIFTLFAAQNWLGVQPRLPAQTKIARQPETPSLTKDHAPQAFLGIPVLAGSSQAWAGFWAFNSGIFSAEQTTLKTILSRLPQDEAAVKQEFLQAAQTPQIVTQGRLNIIDRDKLTAQQKILVQLQAASSLYKSRGQHQIVPAVGFDAFCANGQGVGECPFTVDSFNTWRRFMEERVLDHFCPFIHNDSFSATFQTRWRDALGFQDSPAQIAQLCAGNQAWRSGSIPAKVWEQNWMMVLQMGRNPQLKSGLQQLPEVIRRLKLKPVSGDYQKFVRFHELTPLWIPVANARLQHREGVYAAFRWHAPGMIDHLMAAYNHEIGDRPFTDAMKKLGRQSSDGANPVFDLIHTITESYQASVKAGDSTAAFILRLADRISQDPLLIQTTSRLLEKPEDPFAGILLAYTFPQAMKVGVFEDFAWDHPSYKLMRLAFQSENRRLMLGLVAAFDRLSPKLWKIYQDAKAGYPDLPTMAVDTEKLLRFIAGVLHSADDQGQLSKLWKDLLRQGLADDALASVIRLVHHLREPLVDLNNAWQPSLLENLDQVMHSTLNASLKLTAWLEKIPADASFDLMLRAWRGMTEGSLQHDGRQFWGLLQDRRLGLGENGIILEQMRDPALRADLRFLLKTLWSLEADQVLAAFDEWEDLAISTQKVLHYFEKNVQWRGTGAISYQYFIKTLDHQMENGQQHLRDQLNLLRNWLQPDPVTQNCQSEDAAC